MAAALPVQSKALTLLSCIFYPYQAPPMLSPHRGNALTLTICVAVLRSKHGHRLSAAGGRTAPDKDRNQKEQPAFSKPPEPSKSDNNLAKAFATLFNFLELMGRFELPSYSLRMSGSTT